MVMLARSFSSALDRVSKSLALLSVRLLLLGSVRSTPSTPFIISESVWSSCSLLMLLLLLPLPLLAEKGSLAAGM